MKYAELVPNLYETTDYVNNPSIHTLCQLAKEHQVFVVGGSIPEKEYHKDSHDASTKPLLYNTCVVINPLGEIIAKHRKIHLFDIDIPGKMTFKESDSLIAGDEPTTFDTPFGKRHLF